MIAEPWNFESEAGPNRLIVEVKSKKCNKVYCKCISRFKGMTEYLLLIPRDSFGNYNIFKSGDAAFDEDELEFAMIGSVEQKSRLFLK